MQPDIGLCWKGWKLVKYRCRHSSARCASTPNISLQFTAKLPRNCLGKLPRQLLMLSRCRMEITSRSAQTTWTKAHRTIEARMPSEISSLKKRRQTASHRQPFSEATCLVHTCRAVTYCCRSLARSEKQVWCRVIAMQPAAASSPYSGPTTFDQSTWRCIYVLGTDAARSRATREALFKWDFFLRIWIRFVSQGLAMTLRPRSANLLIVLSAVALSHRSRRKSLRECCWLVSVSKTGMHRIHSVTC